MRAPAVWFLGLRNQFIGRLWKILKRWARKIAKSHKQNLRGCYCGSVEDQKAGRHENVGTKLMGFQRGTRAPLVTRCKSFLGYSGKESGYVLTMS